MFFFLLADDVLAGGQEYVGVSLSKVIETDLVNRRDQRPSQSDETSG